MSFSILQRRWSGILFIISSLGVIPAMSSRANANAPDLTPAPIRSYEELQKAAADLAAQAYQPQPTIPEFLSGMNYDQFRFIGFDNSKMVWGETRLPYRLGFYHKGYVHHDDVRINVLDKQVEVPIPFSRDFFLYQSFTSELPVPDDLGFAGFRVNGCFPGKDEFEEIFSFVGASYFRARPEVGGLGTSARGLAIDVGLPKEEEFPVFREYWIQEPKRDDESLTVLALLDSPTVAGAYQFEMTPGKQSTEMQVQATLYFRTVPEKLGIAPLSSMWMWGDGLAGPEGDHRPEVHDADGLLMDPGDGNWQWRVLSRQEYPSIVRWHFEDLKGFGLLQRDQDRQHYLDDEANYHSRPGVWIKPLSGFGPGAVELLELPAPHEGIDNIAAWWVPDQKPEPGTAWEVSYQLSFFRGDRPDHDLGKATAFRVDREQPEHIRLSIDFVGESLHLEEGAPAIVPMVTSVRGEAVVVSTEETSKGHWTVTLDLKPTGEGPIELSVVLQADGRKLTETWSYLCPLEPPPVSIPPWRKEALEKEKAEKAAAE